MRSTLFKNSIIPLLLTVVFNIGPKISYGGQSDNLPSKSDTAFVPKEIEDPENIGINKGKSHATFMELCYVSVVKRWEWAQTVADRVRWSATR